MMTRAERKLYEAAEEAWKLLAAEKEVLATSPDQIDQIKEQLRRAMLSFEQEHSELRSRKPAVRREMTPDYY